MTQHNVFQQLRWIPPYFSHVVASQVSPLSIAPLTSSSRCSSRPFKDQKMKWAHLVLLFFPLCLSSLEKQPKNEETSWKTRYFRVSASCFQKKDTFGQPSTGRVTVKARRKWIWPLIAVCRHEWRRQVDGATGTWLLYHFCFQKPHPYWGRNAQN